MQSIPFIKVTDRAQYERMAEGAQGTVYMVITDIHNVNLAAFRTSDGGPLISGVVAALMQYIFDGGADWPSARAGIIEQMDNLAPQFEMYRAEKAAGSTDAGTA